MTDDPTNLDDARENRVVERAEDYLSSGEMALLAEERGFDNACEHHAFAWTWPIEGGSDSIGVCSLCQRVTTRERDEDIARAAKAEALREAANDIETALYDEMVPENVKQTAIIDYLRRRADRTLTAERTEPATDAGEARVRVAEVLAAHADCELNGNTDLGSVVSGRDVWSCGISLPFDGEQELDDVERAHIAQALADAGLVAR